MTEDFREKIIFVSSDPVFSDTGITFFKNRGYEFYSFSNEKDLLRSLEDIRPGVVILDDEDTVELLGYKTYEIIKTLDRFKDIKVYLLSYGNPSIDIIDGWIDKGKMEDSLSYFFATEKILEEAGICPLSEDGSPDKEESGVHLTRPEEVRPEAEENLAIHEKAKRLAHAIVSDIYLYNTDKFDQIHNEDDFYRILKEDIERGRRLYHSKIPEGLLSRDYFEETLQELIRHRLYTP